MNKTVLVVGSGPIIIGQAAEFDYAGAQACKSLREEGYRVVLINSNHQLLVEGEMMDISQLRDGAKSFIDNNGVREDLSENPEKAIISLQNDRGTSYKMYIRVQNELAAAYNELRNKASLSKFGERYNDLNKSDQKEIRKVYPQKISEAEPKNIGGNS